MEQDQVFKGRHRSCTRGNIFIILNLLLMLLGLVIILLVTFVRRESSVHRIILFPLRVLFGRRAPGDYWHVTVMNIVLYVPFGCGLSFFLGRSHDRLQHHPALSTVVICLLFSVTAETLQYVLGSGLAEVDDVLMNTFGGIIGTIPYVITSRFQLISSSESVASSKGLDNQ